MNENQQAGLIEERVLGVAPKAVAEHGNDETVLAPLRRGATMEPHVADRWPTALPIVRSEHRDGGGRADSR